MRATLLVALLTTAFACAEPASPSIFPNVAGRWSFTGTMDYGGTTCADTLTMDLSQYGKAVSGRSDDWHFWCGTAQADSNPILRGIGAVRPTDSIRLDWETDPSWTNCAGCPVFVTLGRVADSVMTGRYGDNLGGVGTWTAHLGVAVALAPRVERISPADVNPRDLALVRARLRGAALP